MFKAGMKEGEEAEEIENETILKQKQGKPKNKKTSTK